MEYKRTKLYTKDFVDNHKCEYTTDNKKFQDLTGKTFQQLTVLKIHYRNSPHTFWFCQCTCGNIVSKNTSQLNSGKHKMCTNCSFKIQAELMSVDVGVRWQQIRDKIKNDIELVEVLPKKWKILCKDCNTPFLQDHSAIMNPSYKGTPCRCDNGVKFMQWTTDLREIQIKDLCSSRDLNFIGWVDPSGYSRNTSRILLECNNSHPAYQISINNFLSASSYGCPLCFEDRRGAGKKFNTEKFIEDARVVHGDKFDYSEYEYTCSRTPSRIKCRVCDLPFNASYDNHVNKGRGCPHEKGKTHLYTYILAIYDKDALVGIKIGKATNHINRIKEHIVRNPHLVLEVIGVWQYPDTDWCNKAETSVKRTFKGSHIDPINFKSGNTETLCPTEIESVIEVYEYHMGKRINFIKEHNT